MMNPLLSTVILKYKEIYPNINLFVQGLRTEEIRKALLENELDFGVVFLPVEDGKSWNLSHCFQNSCPLLFQ